MELFVIPSAVLSLVNLVHHVASWAQNTFSNKKTGWKDWDWSIDDDEINQEKIGYLQVIPFRDIRKLRPHPDFPEDIRQKKFSLAYFMDSSVDTEKRRFFVRIGRMDDYVGNGSPYGDLCYCLYERRGGISYIHRFFSRGNNKHKVRQWLLSLEQHEARL